MSAESIVFNEDCIEVMKRYPDKHFDLAVVDPPYGISINPNMGLKSGQAKRHNTINWDNSIPDSIYFDELFRVSKNQIIWGGNYFPLPPTKHFIFWDKMNPAGLSFSDGEMAWTSFDRAIRVFRRRNTYDGKIHPTQKPEALYDWIYANYAKPNDLILDTHLGSGSSRIAAQKAGLSFVGCELDKEYFDAQEKRYKDFISQIRMDF
jgi:site-specific DNA-methyltransferase (adenine-specific)